MAKIKCKNKNKEEARRIRVKVLKAPFVDSEILRQVISERSRAIVI